MTKMKQSAEINCIYFYYPGYYLPDLTRLSLTTSSAPFPTTSLHSLPVPPLALFALGENNFRSPLLNSFLDLHQSASLCTVKLLICLPASVNYPPAQKNNLLLSVCRIGATHLHGTQLVKSFNPGI